jgi:hypothetical protein
VTFGSPLLALAPPSSGADLVDRHWAVATIPAARRQALLEAAARGPVDDPELGHTLATAFEYAALVGRDALRSGAATPAARLEREALRLGAARAARLHAAVGLGGGDAAAPAEALLRDAARLVALGAVGGAAALAETRRRLGAAPAAERLEQAEQAVADGRDPSADAARLWMLWRRLLTQPEPDELAHIVAELARRRERRLAATEPLAPAADDAELRTRFRAAALHRLAEAAALLTLALRDRGEAEATGHALSAHCAAARAGLPGDPGVVMLATWLELGALATIRRRHDPAA